MHLCLFDVYLFIYILFRNVGCIFVYSLFHRINDGNIDQFQSKLEKMLEKTFYTSVGECEFSGMNKGGNSI